MSELIQQALEIAATFHAKQYDKVGEPYYFHLARVSGAGTTEAECVVGALHDLFEDTPASPTIIREAFGDEITDAIVCLTRCPGEGYKAFINRCGANPLARRVKINDLRDNFGRLGNLRIKDEAESIRLAKRYGTALMILGGF